MVNPQNPNLSYFPVYKYSIIAAKISDPHNQQPNISKEGEVLVLFLVLDSIL